MGDEFIPNPRHQYRRGRFLAAYQALQLGRPTKNPYAPSEEIINPIQARQIIDNARSIQKENPNDTAYSPPLPQELENIEVVTRQYRPI